MGGNVIRYVKSTRVIAVPSMLLSNAFPGLAFYNYTTGIKEAYWGNNNKVYFFKEKSYLVFDITRNNTNSLWPEGNVVNTTTDPSPFTQAFGANSPDVVLTESLKYTPQAGMNIPKVFAILGDKVSLLPARFHSDCGIDSYLGAAAVARVASTGVPDLLVSAYGCSTTKTSSAVGERLQGRVWSYQGSSNGLVFTGITGTNADISRCGNEIGFALDLGFANRNVNRNIYKPTVSSLVRGEWKGAGYVFDDLNSASATAAYRMTPTFSDLSRYGHAILSRGDFNNDGYEDFAISAIRGDGSPSTGSPMFAGTVQIFSGAGGAFSTAATSRLNFLNGPIVGTGFGHCLEVADLNGDGRDDLIVCAPDHYAGRVYVYLQSTSGLPNNPTSFVDGTETYEEFGATAVRIGDLNKDGKDDIAIGAPMYNGQEGRVFLYFGAATTGLNPTPGQIITGRSVFGPTYPIPLQFGFAISALDIDSDTYPDLLVGAPKLDNTGGVVVLYSNDQSDTQLAAALTPSNISVPGSFSIAFTVKNLGPNIAKDVNLAFDISDLKIIKNPPTLTLSAGVTSALVNNTLKFSIGNLAVASTATITANFGALNNTYLYPSPLAYSASITQDPSVYDTTPNNNAVSGNVFVFTNVDLAFQNSPVLVRDDTLRTATVITQGQPVVIPSVVLKNLGPATAFNTAIRFTLPAGLKKTGIITSHGTCTGISSIECNFGNLLVGETVTLTNVTFSTSTYSSLSSVTITAVSSSFDPVPDTAHPNTISTNLLNVDFTTADLVAISASALPNPVVAGAPLSLFASLGSNGPRAANANVSLVVNSGLVVTAASVRSLSGTCTWVVIAGGSTNVTCNIPSFPSLGSGSISVSAITLANLTSAHTFTINAAVFSNLADNVPNNNRITSAATAVTVSNLMSVSHRRLDYGTLYLGSTSTIVVTSRNSGPSNMQSPTTLQITFNKLLTANALTYPGNCSVSNTTANVVISCPIAALPVGQSVDTQLSFKILRNATHDPIIVFSTLPAAVSPSPLVYDIDTSVDLSVIMYLPFDDQVALVTTQNSFVAVNFAVRNNANNAANVVFLEVLVPTGTTFDSGQVGSTACTSSPVTGGALVRCGMGALPAFATANGVFKVKFPTAGIFVFTATTKSEYPSEIDSVPTNDVASFTATITSFSNIALTFNPVDTGYGAVRGRDITYNAAIINYGPSDAQNVYFVLSYNASLVYLSIFNKNGTYSCTHNVAARYINCTIGSMAPLAIVDNLRFTFNVSLTNPDTNTTTTGFIAQTVDEGPGDPLTDNIVVLHTDIENPSVDFEVASVIASPITLTADSTNYLTVTVTLSNRGQYDDAPLLLATDFLPGIRVTNITYIRGSSGVVLLDTQCPINRTAFIPWNCTLPVLSNNDGYAVVTVTAYYSDPSKAVKGDYNVQFEVQSTGLPDAQPNNDVLYDTVTVVIPVASALISGNEGIAWWIILLAAVGGCLLMGCKFIYLFS